MASVSLVGSVATRRASTYSPNAFFTSFSRGFDKNSALRSAVLIASTSSMNVFKRRSKRETAIPKVVASMNPKRARVAPTNAPTGASFSRPERRRRQEPRRNPTSIEIVIKATVARNTPHRGRRSRKDKCVMGTTLPIYLYFLADPHHRCRYPDRCSCGSVCRFRVGVSGYERRGKDLSGE